MNKICWWLDSNHGSLVSEATTLPNEPQPLPHLLNVRGHKFCRSFWSLPLMQFTCLAIYPPSLTNNDNNLEKIFKLILFWQKCFHTSSTLSINLTPVIWSSFFLLFLCTFVVVAVSQIHRLQIDYSWRKCFFYTLRVKPMAEFEPRSSEFAWPLCQLCRNHHWPNTLQVFYCQTVTQCD